MDKDIQARVNAAIRAGANPQEAARRGQLLQQSRRGGSISQGNLQSPNLLQNTGMVSSLVNSATRPFVQTGQQIGGGAFEAVRALLNSAGQKGLYDTDRATGRAKVQNPFLSDEKLNQASNNPLSYLGNQAVQSAGVASYGIPVGGASSLFGRAVAPGALKGGALVGGIQAATEPGSNLDSIALGAATGGVAGKALDVVGKGLSGASRLGSKVQQTGTSARVGKIRVKPSVSGAAQEKLVKQTLSKYGIKGTPQSKYEKIEPTMNKISESIQSLLNLNPKKVSQKVLRDTFRKKVAPLVRQGDLTLNEATKGFNDYIRNVQEVSPGVLANSKGLFELKKDLQSGMSSIYKKVGNQNSLTATQKSVKAIRDTFDEILTSLHPEVKELTLDQSRLFDAVRPLAQQRQTVPTVRALGITIPRGPVNAASDVAASGLERIGSGMQGLPQVNIPQGAKNIASRGGSFVNSSMQTAGPAEVGAVMDSPQVSSYQNQQGSTLTPQFMAALEMSNISETTKDKFRKAYDYQKQGQGSTSVTARARQDLANSGLSGLSDAYEIFTKDPNIVLKGTVTGGLASRKYDAAINRAVEALLRARSGAAVPESEVSRYKKQYTPQLGDSYDTAVYKIQALQQDLMGMLSGNQNLAPDYAPVNYQQ